ncbi:MAG: DNA-binding response regulator [Acidimicrobiales bacterium]|nr:DNA-binding response regulator [Acidimicrobiales bacterium]
MADGGGDRSGPVGERILVVDDEPAILRALSVALRARGYVVHTAATGQGALDQTALLEPATVILDLGLPDIDGVDVCRRIRQWSDVPIVVLTADGADDRKVEALDVGADDYVTKPFSTPELLARLRVALRHRSRQGDGVVDGAVARVGDLTVDLAYHQVAVDGRPVALTPKEFAFVEVLARHPGRVITHRALLQEVWGPEYGAETQYLRVYASQIRKKLGDRADKRRLLTVAGVGYRLVDADAEVPT